uniref:RRM domain-containing protein n=1 Tax=Kalanchoe fedtschenkoi TaxID=63787 RepID=A0A7N0TPS8_KALFE
MAAGIDAMIIAAIPLFSSSSQHKPAAAAAAAIPFHKPCNYSAFLYSSRNHSAARGNRLHIISGCLDPKPTTKLYVSGLSFRTTEEGLKTAFQTFGQLLEVNLVMDKIANRPRGFAFLRYATEEESRKAIEGMHGKFLDGRVIFVEVAKPRSELRKSANQRLYE